MVLTRRTNTLKAALRDADQDKSPGAGLRPRHRLETERSSRSKSKAATAASRSKAKSKAKAKKTPAKKRGSASASAKRGKRVASPAPKVASDMPDALQHLLSVWTPPKPTPRAARAFMLGVYDFRSSSISGNWNLRLSAFSHADAAFPFFYELKESESPNQSVDLPKGLWNGLYGGTFSSVSRMPDHDELIDHPDRQIEISFRPYEDVENAYEVEGKGRNKFGVFTLAGVLDSASGNVLLYREYAAPKPSPQRVTRSAAKARRSSRRSMDGEQSRRIDFAFKETPKPKRSPSTRSQKKPKKPKRDLTESDIDGMTCKQLHEVCNEQGLKKFNKLRKKELIAFVKQHMGFAEAAEAEEEENVQNEDGGDVDGEGEGNEGEDEGEDNEETNSLASVQSPDFGSMKVKELRAELAKYDLETSGRKAQLVERLQNFHGTSALADQDDDDEDVEEEEARSFGQDASGIFDDDGATEGALSERYDTASEGISSPVVGAESPTVTFAAETASSASKKKLLRRGTPYPSKMKSAAKKAASKVTFGEAEAPLSTRKRDRSSSFDRKGTPHPSKMRKVAMSLPGNKSVRFADGTAEKSRGPEEAPAIKGTPYPKAPSQRKPSIAPKADTPFPQFKRAPRIPGIGEQFNSPDMASGSARGNYVSPVPLGASLSNSSIASAAPDWSIYHELKEICMRVSEGGLSYSDYKLFESMLARFTSPNSPAATSAPAARSSSGGDYLDRAMSALSRIDKATAKVSPSAIF